MTEKIMFVTFWKTKTHEQKAFSGKIYLRAGSFDNFETLPYRAGIPTPQRQPTRRCRWILFLSIQRRAQFSQRHLLLLLLLSPPPTMQCHETTQHTAQHGHGIHMRSMLGCRTYFLPNAYVFVARKSAKIFVSIFLFQALFNFWLTKKRKS